MPFFIFDNYCLDVPCIVELHEVTSSMHLFSHFFTYQNNLRSQFSLNNCIDLFFYNLCGNCGLQETSVNMQITVNEFDMQAKNGSLCYYVSVLPEYQCNLLERYPNITSFSDSADRHSGMTRWHYFNDYSKTFIYKYCKPQI